MRSRWLVVVVAVLAGAVAAGVGSGANGQLRVGLVLAQGSRQDRGVGQAVYESFVNAVARLRLKGRVVEFGPQQDPRQALVSLARQRFDLIVASSAVYPADSTAVAFPNVRFLVLDFPHSELPHRPKNVQTTLLRVQEAAYLAGYLAALTEKRRAGKDVVGSIGGIPVPEINSFIAGFQAGARKADPGIRTLNGYSKDFAASAKCRSIALREINAGAGVVFPFAGACGLGALDAARRSHVWGIGVDVDQSFLGPHILTSVVKRYDVAIYSELRALTKGMFTTGGTTSLGLKENGVGLGRISPKVPPAFLRELRAIRSRIAGGKIRVPSRLN